MALFFSFLVVLLTFMLLITQSHLSIAQDSSPFKHLNTHKFMYVTLILHKNL